MKILSTVCLCWLLSVMCYSQDQQASSGPLKLKAELSHSALVKNKRQKVYLKVSLIANNKKKPLNRNPLNLCIVLDKSGSMNGENLQQAKKASKVILNSLQKKDIISFVTYDKGVQILIPAMIVKDKVALNKLIDGIKGSGSTAIFAGISKGLFELEKYASVKYVNRMILLSDGMATVGHVSLKVIGDLGKGASKRNISISTIGIGNDYNEDFMSILSIKSDGSHGFAESPEQISRLLEIELSLLASVVGKKLNIVIECPKGIKPLRVLDRDALIRNNKITINMNQIYHNQNKFILVELEVEDTANIKEDRKIANIQLNYYQSNSEKPTILKTGVGINWVSSAKSQKNKKMLGFNNGVMISVEISKAAEQNRMAMLMCNDDNIKQTLKSLEYTCQVLSLKNVSLKSDQIEELNDVTKQLKKDIQQQFYKRSKKAWKSYYNGNASQNKLNNKFQKAESKSKK